MADGESSVAQATAFELFFGFARTALRSFGGVLPWARRLVVEERGWLSEREFADVLGVCQFLPGPNIVNVSIVVGRRFGGWRGALAAATGLLLPPFLVVLGAALAFDVVADVPLVAAAFRGLAGAAAGLTLGMGLKMLAALRRGWVGVLVSLLAFSSVAILHMPLLGVVLGGLPLSIALDGRFGARS